MILPAIVNISSVRDGASWALSLPILESWQAWSGACHSCCLKFMSVMATCCLEDSKHLRTLPPTFWLFNSSRLLLHVFSWAFRGWELIQMYQLSWNLNHPLFSAFWPMWVSVLSLCSIFFCPLSMSTSSNCSDLSAFSFMIFFAFFSVHYFISFVWDVVFNIHSKRISIIISPFKVSYSSFKETPRPQFLFPLI